jgi:hypothetical protein
MATLAMPSHTTHPVTPLHAQAPSFDDRTPQKQDQPVPRLASGGTHRNLSPRARATNTPSAEKQGPDERSVEDEEGAEGDDSFNTAKKQVKMEGAGTATNLSTSTQNLFSAVAAAVAAAAAATSSSESGPSTPPLPQEPSRTAGASTFLALPLALRWPVTLVVVWLSKFSDFVCVLGWGFHDERCMLKYRV